MRIQQLAVLSIIGIAASQAMFNDHRAFQRTVNKGRMGSMELVEWEDNGMVKTVYLPQKEIVKDYERQTRILQEAQVQAKVNKERMDANKIYTCDNRDAPGEEYDPTDAGYFIPVGVGAINSASTSVTYTNGFCFKNITFSYSQTGNEDDIGDVTITVDTESPDSLLCKDWFFFGTTELSHVETFYFSGKHQIQFKNISPNAKADIVRNGVRIYMFCDGYADTFVSVYNTLLCFVGGLGTNATDPIFGSHVPEYMEKANVNFLKEVMGLELELRETTEYPYDANLIQSGDFIAITRLDGVDPIIMYGSGTHSGHSVMALRSEEDGELYIIESQDGWYWPRHGIQKNKWTQWIEWAKNADFHVTHMPLKAEVREVFNVTAAWEFFNKTEGLPYGYHNFLFGWVDTAVDNWPPLLPAGFIPIVFSILEDFTPNTTNVFLDQALNKRLNTTGLNLDQIAGEAARQNKSIEDLMAMVEVEGWQYEGLEPRDGSSYVCSAYVAAVFQAAGVLHDINGPEFTPKDVYTLNIYDLNFTRPAECVSADPTLPYCQILGKYRMTHPGYSTVQPYSNMAEHCPTIAPAYNRPDNC